MIPVMQTVFGPKGNCFAACLASLFELSLDEVPDFVNETVDDDWSTPVRAWLAPRGFGFLTITLNGDLDVVKELKGYSIVCGESERELCHATIWCDGILVHDPHPNQSGIKQPEYVDLIYPLNAAKLKLL